MKTSFPQLWSILILILLLCLNSFSQSKYADKLSLQVSKETNDTSKIKLLIQLGLKMGLDSPDQISCFKEVNDLSKKTNFRSGLVYAQFYEALTLWSIGRNDEALDKYKRCIDGLDSLGVIQTREHPLATIRILFSETGRQEEKFQYYSQKAVYYKRYGPKENMANCYHGIAGYYSNLGDYDKSIEYYMRARDIYKSFNPDGYATNGVVIGSEYLNWGNLEKAEEFLKSGLNEFLKKNEVWDIVFCYNKLGDLFVKRLDYKHALGYYYAIQKYWPDLPAAYIVIDMVSIAAVHLKLNSADSAKIYLHRAEEIRKNDNLPIISNHGPLEIDYHYFLYFEAIRDQKHALKRLEAALQEAKSFKYIALILKYTNELHSFLLKKGDSLQALRYLIEYHAIQDSLNKMNTQARIASFEIEQQQEQKETKIEQLKVQKATQRNYYLFAGILLIMIVFGVISRIIYKRKKDKEQLTTDFKKQLAEAETKALRAQMNPHFIFNSLNSINSFVMDQKHEIASDYLIKFSKLIRLILDNSRSETISIEKELETLKLYVILESARFDNKFKCVYKVAEDVNTNAMKMPPMLLQPFVENAIWHGLMQKEGEGTITIDISMNNEQVSDNSEQLLRITITDDGIGREKAAELKSKSATHKSHGLKVTSQRIEMMNKLNSAGAKVNIIDMKDEQGNAMGMKVELIIPF